MFLISLNELVFAVPVQDSPCQRLLDRYRLPSKLCQTNIAPPYTLGHRDSLNKAINTMGSQLDPLPQRNGLGALVLRP